MLGEFNLSAEIRPFCKKKKTGKQFINQALYIESLNCSVSTCMNKTVATYKAYLKAIHTRVSEYTVVDDHMLVRLRRPPIFSRI